MDLIEFPGHNVVLGKNQPEYRPLPALRLTTPEGPVIFCWKLSWRERIKLLLTGRIWQTSLTFNHLFQPQLLELEVPHLVQIAQTVESETAKIGEQVK